MGSVERVRQTRNGRLQNAGWRATVGEHATGLGATIPQARDNAMILAESMLSGHYNPTVVRLGDQFAVVFREPSGWHTTHIRTVDDYPEGHTRVYGNGGDANEADAIRRAKYHMAQNTFNPLRGPAQARSLLMFVDPADVADLKQWIGFQRAWRAIEQAIKLFYGVGAELEARVLRVVAATSEAPLNADNKIHEWACRHAAEYAPQVDIYDPTWEVTYQPSTFHLQGVPTHCPCTACESIRKEVHA